MREAVHVLGVGYPEADPLGRTAVHERRGDEDVERCDLREQRRSAGSDCGAVCGLNTETSPLRRTLHRERAIDVGRFVDRMERDLRSGANDHVRRMDILAVLRRWQYDERLDERSQHRAKVLVREFSSGRS